MKWFKKNKIYIGKQELLDSIIEIRELRVVVNKILEHLGMVYCKSTHELRKQSKLKEQPKK